MCEARRFVALLSAVLLCVALPAVASAGWQEFEASQGVRADFDGYPSEHECFYRTASPVSESVQWSGSGPFYKFAPESVRYDRGGPECPDDWPSYIVLSGWVKHWFKMSDGTWESWPPTYTQHIWQLTGNTSDGSTFVARGRVRHSPDGCAATNTGPLFYGPWPSLGWPCSW